MAPLVEALDNPELAATAATALKDTLLVFDAFYDVEAKAKAGNAHAKEVPLPHMVVDRTVDPPLPNTKY